jgi:hypothetical protein
MVLTISITGFDLSTISAGAEDALPDYSPTLNIGENSAWVYDNIEKSVNITGYPDGMDDNDKPNFTVYYSKGELTAEEVIADIGKTTTQPKDAGKYSAVAVLEAKGGYEEKITNVVNFEIRKKVITLKAADGSWEYDGNPHSIGSLDPAMTLDQASDLLVGEGESFRSLNVNGTITEVGTAENIVTYQLTSSVNQANYDIVCEAGILTVTHQALQPPADSMWDMGKPGTAKWLAVVKPGVTIKYRLKLYAVNEETNEITCIAGEDGNLLAEGNSYDLKGYIHSFGDDKTEKYHYYFTVSTVPFGGDKKDNYLESSAAGSGNLYTARFELSKQPGFEEIIKSLSIKNSTSQTVTLIQGESFTVSVSVIEGYAINKFSVDENNKDRVTYSGESGSGTLKTATVTFKTSGIAESVVGAKVSADIKPLPPKVNLFEGDNTDDLGSVTFTGKIYDYLGNAMYRFVKEDEADSSTAVWTFLDGNKGVEKSVTLENVTESGTYILQVKYEGGETDKSANVVNVYKIGFVGDSGVNEMSPIYKIGNTSPALPKADVKDGYSFLYWSGEHTGINLDEAHMVANVDDTLEAHSIASSNGPADGNAIVPKLSVTGKDEYVYGYGSEPGNTFTVFTNNIFTNEDPGCENMSPEELAQHNALAAQTIITGYQWYLIKYDENGNETEEEIAGHGRSATLEMPLGYKVGTYTFRCRVNVKNAASQKTESGTVDYHVNVVKAPMSVSLRAYNGIFDNRDHSIGVTVYKAEERKIYYSTVGAIDGNNYSDPDLNVTEEAPLYKHVTYDESSGNVLPVTTYVYIRDLSGNYEDYTGTATVKINPKELQVKSTDRYFEKMYDGNNRIGGTATDETSDMYRFSQGDYYEVIGYIDGDHDTEGYTLTGNATYNSYHVSKATSFNITGMKIVDKSTGDEVHDYYFKPTYSFKFTGYITPRIIDIEWVFPEETTIYNGVTIPTYVYDDTEKAPEIRLSVNQRYEIPDTDTGVRDTLIVSNKQVNAGIHRATAAVNPPAGAHYEAADYSFSITEQPFEITKLTVVVTPEDRSVRYNGQRHGLEEYSVSGLLTGQEHRNTAVYDQSRVNAGVYPDMKLKNLHIYNSRGHIVDDNYNIIYEEGTLTIAPCPVNVSGIKIPDTEYDNSSAITNFDLTDLTFEPEGSTQLFMNAETGERDVLALDPEKIYGVINSYNASMSQIVDLTIADDALADVAGKDLARNYELIPDESQTSATVNIIFTKPAQLEVNLPVWEENKPGSVKWEASKPVAYVDVEGYELTLLKDGNVVHTVNVDATKNSYDFADKIDTGLERYTVRIRAIASTVNNAGKVIVTDSVVKEAKYVKPASATPGISGSPSSQTVSEAVSSRPVVYDDAANINNAAANVASVNANVRNDVVETLPVSDAVVADSVDSTEIIDPNSEKEKTESVIESGRDEDGSITIGYDLNRDKDPKHGHGWGCIIHWIILLCLLISLLLIIIYQLSIRRDKEEEKDEVYTVEEMEKRIRSRRRRFAFQAILVGILNIFGLILAVFFRQCKWDIPADILFVVVTSLSEGAMHHARKHEEKALEDKEQKNA